MDPLDLSFNLFELDKKIIGAQRDAHNVSDSKFLAHLTRTVENDLDSCDTRVLARLLAGAEQLNHRFRKLSAAADVIKEKAEYNKERIDHERTLIAEAYMLRLTGKRAVKGSDDELCGYS